jgi:hypothetical protein
LIRRGLQCAVGSRRDENLINWFIWQRGILKRLRKRLNAVLSRKLEEGRINFDRNFHLFEIVMNLVCLRHHRRI